MMINKHGIHTSKIKAGDKVTIGGTYEVNEACTYSVNIGAWINNDLIVSHTPKLRDFKVGDNVSVAIRENWQRHGTIKGIDTDMKTAWLGGLTTCNLADLRHAEPETES